MATQIDRVYDLSTGSPSILVLEATLITSGTTITYTLPPGTRLLGHFLHNRTTNAITAGGTYTESTGVWVSGTAAVNDLLTATFITA